MAESAIIADLSQRMWDLSDFLINTAELTTVAQCRPPPPRSREHSAGPAGQGRASWRGVPWRTTSWPTSSAPADSPARTEAGSRGITACSPQCPPQCPLAAYAGGRGTHRLDDGLIARTTADVRPERPGSRHPSGWCPGPTASAWRKSGRAHRNRTESRRCPRMPLHRVQLTALRHALRVVISAPSAAAASTRHDLTGCPSSSTVQAPQSPFRHPEWVPLSRSCSRTPRRADADLRTGPGSPAVHRHRHVPIRHGFGRQLVIVLLMGSVQGAAQYDTGHHAAVIARGQLVVPGFADPRGHPVVDVGVARSRPASSSSGARSSWIGRVLIAPRVTIAPEYPTPAGGRTAAAVAMGQLPSASLSL